MLTMKVVDSPVTFNVHISQAFRQAVLQLKNSGILVVKCVSIKHPKSVQPSVEEASSDSIDGDQFLVERSMNEQSLFFCKMFEPFLVAYWVSAI